MEGARSDARMQQRADVLYRSPVPSLTTKRAKRRYGRRLAAHFGRYDACPPVPPMSVRISIVVPVFNEEQNVAPLVSAVRAALGVVYDWELILVDDGSTDATAAEVLCAAREDPRVRLLPLARNYGQTPAMQAGFEAARGDVVLTMDGDLQNDPADIPVLLDKIAEGYDLVAGYRVGRRDHALKRKVPSWVANRIIRWITRVSIRDNGCSLKAYRRELLDHLHLYSDMHRFIPAVAAGTMGARITEVPVRHHARRFGTSKYGLSRIAKVLADIMTIKMIRSFRDRPLLLFGSVALGASGLGAAFLVASAVAIIRFSPAKAQALVLPASGILFLGLAFNLLLLGLIAETAVRRRHRVRRPLALFREVSKPHQVSMN
jgi:glycosyltransferase involved in cell wall biosynthesis